MEERQKRAVIRFFNAYWLKEYVMLLKHCEVYFSKSGKQPMLISVIDKRRKTKGLTDRFKGIVSMYALSKAIGVPFRLIFDHPFELSEFLEPHAYNWKPQAGELSDCVSDVRFKIMSKQPPLSKLTKIFPLTRQVWVYAKVDYLEEINAQYHTDFHWGALFHELFKPSELLEQHLRIHLNNLGRQAFIACVFRFQSLLGDFKEYHFETLDPAAQQELIQKNKEALREIVEQSDVPVLVTSDSVTFLATAGDLPGVYTIPGKVVHIDNVDDAGKEVYMKSFIDFLMLSRARKIYSIGTSAMYKTDFPKYAAKLNEVPFERILVE